MKNADKNERKKDIMEIPNFHEALYGSDFIYAKMRKQLL